MSKKTAETSTSAVRSSTAAAEARRQRLDRRLGHPDDLEPFLRQPIELPADGVELAIGGDEPRPRPERQGREKAHDQLVGVRPQRDTAARIAQQAGEARAHPLGLGEGPIPLVVHVPRGVEPGRRLRRRSPRSGQAWCECPVSSSRSATRNRE